MSGSGTRTRSAPAPITGESDFRTTYRRKPFPRRRKKQWIRFTKKVKHVLHKQVAKKSIVYVKALDFASTDNKQGVSSAHTVLASNGVGPSADDISYVFDRVLQEELVSTPGLAKDNLKCVITGWLSETQVINTSATSTAYIDMYYWRCIGNVPNSLGSVTQVLTDGFADINSVPPAGGSPLDLLDYGVTPFQCPQFSKHFKVWKKTRVKLAPGGVTQIETRSGKDYVRTWSHDEHYSFLRGVSEGVYFIAYGTPDPLIAATYARAVTLRTLTNTNITYRVVANNVFTGSTNVP